jgi:hypothetical protein
VPSGNANWQVSKNIESGEDMIKTAELIHSHSQVQSINRHTHTACSHGCVHAAHTHSESPKGKVELSTRETKANHIKPSPTVNLAQSSTKHLHRVSHQKSKALEQEEQHCCSICPNSPQNQTKITSTRRSRASTNSLLKQPSTPTHYF